MVNGSSVSKVVIETQYLPTIAFYSFMINSDYFLIEAHENYQKGSFRNKAQILSSQGPLTLSVPLMKGKNNQLNIKKVKIDNQTHWQLNHLRALKSCYGKSAFFEFYFDDIEAIYKQSFDFLFEVNTAFIITINKLLSIPPPNFTDQYQKEYRPECDKRGFVSPKAKHQQRLHGQFTFSIYDQVFCEQQAFVSNLSILDLLFCMGPESVIYLKSIYNQK